MYGIFVLPLIRLILLTFSLWRFYNPKQMMREKIDTQQKFFNLFTSSIQCSVYNCHACPHATEMISEARVRSNYDDYLVRFQNKEL